METGHWFKPKFSKEELTISLTKPIRGEDSGEASVIQMLHVRTYIVSYCHGKKTGECYVSISFFNFNPYSFVANTCLPAWWFSLIVKLGIFFCVLVTVFCIVDCLTFFIEITEPVDHRVHVSGAPMYRI